ncbi:MAG: TolC family protein [Betaproteobacteria bacterium]|nr:TolC family protein [Betaproteobacteria bacterium]
MKHVASVVAVLLVCLSASRSIAQQQQQPLTLKEARQIALANRPLVRAVDLSVAGARQNTIQVQSARYPQLSASITAADAYRETTTQDGKEVTLDTRIAAGGLNNPTILRRESNGLFLSQLITDFGRTANLVESAKFAETAQQHLANATRAQVILETSDAYFAALAAQSVLRVAAKTVDARSLLFDKISALARNKIKSELDVRFAQVNLGEARLLQLKAENAVDAAFARLSTSLGYHDARRFTLADESTAEPLGDIDTLLGQAVAARPELASLRADREAAKKSVDAAKALSYPTINLYAAAGVTPYGDDRLSRNYGAIGLNLSVPLFDGGKISALQQQAQLRSLALSENLVEAQNNVLRSVRVAWLNARSGYENIGITENIRDAASQVLSLAESRYNLGITSIVELNQAQLSAIDAEIANSRARYDYLIARTALDYEVGALDLTGATK